MNPDPRVPVLVGAAAVQQHDDDPLAAAEAVELMARAVEAAAADAGATSLLQAIDRIAVPHGTWSYSNPASLIAARVGAARARTMLSGLGIPQQTLINDAIRSVMAGELDVAVVVGGEAKRRDAAARRLGVGAPVTDQGGAAPDDHSTVEGVFIAAGELDAGIVVPVQQYALIEHALGHTEHRSLAELRDEVATLWSRASAVAAANPAAAFPTERPAAWLRDPSPENRPLAFPYNKWHSTQWTVDQAAALIICSADAARAHGVDRERWVYPRVALESSHAASLSVRRDLHRWHAMEVLGRTAAAHLGRALSDVEHIDLYSCFPAAVRVQQRELGLPLDGVPTITGTMAFAGGPFNNYVFQATAAMIERVRASRGELGLVTTVCGMLTKPGLAVWSTDPGAGVLVDDLAIEAEAATPTVAEANDYDGPATIATLTVTYDGDAPARVVVIADTPDGARCVATSDDAELAARATVEDLIGLPARLHGHQLAALD